MPLIAPSCASTLGSTPSFPSHVLTHEAAELLRHLDFPLPVHSTHSNSLLSTDALSLLDLVLHLNDTYALSFWVLRSLVSELNRTVRENEEKPLSYTPPGPPSSLPCSPRTRAEELLTACETIQHAKDSYDNQLGRLVLCPILLSCLFFYVDATAYDAAALRRDVSTLLAPGGGPARYCVEVEDEEADEDTEIVGTILSASCQEALSQEDGCNSDDSVGSTQKIQAPTSLQLSDDRLNASTATRRRWQRERSRITALPPPQSDVAALLVNITAALYQSSPGAPRRGSETTALAVNQSFTNNITVPSQATDAIRRQAYTLPWLSPLSCTTNCGIASDIQLWRHHPSVVPALLQRGQSCLTKPFVRCATSPPLTRTSIPSDLHPFSAQGLGESVLPSASSVCPGLHSSGIQQYFVSSSSARMTFAAYCEGLRRRHGARSAVVVAEEPDGVVVGRIYNTQRAQTTKAQTAHNGSDRRKAQRFVNATFSRKRNKFLIDPLASLYTRPASSAPQCSTLPPVLGVTNDGDDQYKGVPATYGTACSFLRASPSDTLSVASRLERKRQRTTPHWSDTICQNLMTTAPEKIQKKLATGEMPLSDNGGSGGPICKKYTYSNAVSFSVSPPTPTRRSLTQQLPSDIQRLCLEYVSPRYMRTVSTVCVLWYRFIRSDATTWSSSSYLSLALHASAAVTQAYTRFFQRQWGEQAMPVTLFTSLHRLGFMLLVGNSATGAAAVVQSHWTRVRKDADVCAYVRQQLQVSPLRHIMSAHEENKANLFSASSIETCTAAREALPWCEAKAKPLSAALYAFYVLCVIPTTPPFTRSPLPHAGEEANVIPALRSLLSAWSTELKWSDLWSAPSDDPSVSSLLTREVTRQQKLIWWLLTNPSIPLSPSTVTVRNGSRSAAPANKPGEEAGKEDFLAHLWSEWDVVRDVFRYSETSPPRDGGEATSN